MRNYHKKNCIRIQNWNLCIISYATSTEYNLESNYSRRLNGSWEMLTLGNIDITNISSVLVRQSSSYESQTLSLQFWYEISLSRVILTPYESLDFFLNVLLFNVHPLWLRNDNESLPSNDPLIRSNIKHHNENEINNHYNIYSTPFHARYFIGLLL